MLFLGRGDVPVSVAVLCCLGRVDVPVSMVVLCCFGESRCPRFHECCVFQGEPMPIVYRMRGLLGDATEDMVNSLDSGSGQCCLSLGP